MSNSDTPSGGARFTLTGCRDLLDADIPIGRQVTALEEAVEKNPELAFDLAKTLIETVCKTILNDRGHTPDGAWDLPKLFKETTSKLQVLPDSHSDDVKMAEALRKTAGALGGVVQGLCEVRNLRGFASHGKDAYDPSIEDAIQAQFVARSADAVVHFLFQIHHNYAGPLARRPRLQYTDNSDFNSYLDENNASISIFDLTYQPSEVLFSTDMNAYQTMLDEFRSEPTYDSSA